MNLQGEQMLTGDITHALTPVAGIQRIAMQAVRTATWLSVPIGGIYGMCGMLYQDMVTKEYVITTESSESANTRSECAVLEFADTVTLHIATITTSGMLTWRLQTRRIPVEQRDPWRRRIAHTCVTRVNVVTKGGSTTPPHSTVGTEGGRTTTPHTTPPPTTPPPTMERQSEPPPATEATVAVEQLRDMATLFMKCQVLAFFEAIWTFSLYILYCEPLGDKKGVGHTMHYGPWRWT